MTKRKPMPTLIDTRDAFRRLQDQGGFSEDQADAIVDIFTDVDEQVATRGDIEQLRSELGQLRTEMESLEDRLGRRVESVRSDLTRTVVTTGAAVCAFLAVALSLVIYLVG